MKINEDVWEFIQKHLGYNVDEMKLFRQNPRNEDVISKAWALMSKTIIVEVVEASGCNSGHKQATNLFSMVREISSPSSTLEKSAVSH